MQGKSGFDVIIGNPPYVNFKKIPYSFPENTYTCAACSDLFAITIERSHQLINNTGITGFIIPLSGLSTESMVSLRNHVFSGKFSNWNSYYSASDQPASLFSGVRHRLLITINKVNKNGVIQCYSTNFIKWFSNERQFLFDARIVYRNISTFQIKCIKISTAFEKRILGIFSNYKTIANYISSSGKPVYYHNAPVHWGKIFDFVPYYSVAGKQQQSSHLKELTVMNDNIQSVIISLLNSTFFYWYNWQFSNCRDLSQKDVLRAPINSENISPELQARFQELRRELLRDFKKNSRIYKRV